MRLRDSVAEESVNWSHDICSCLQNLCFNFLMMKVRISWLELSVVPQLNTLCCVDLRIFPIQHL